MSQSLFRKFFGMSNLRAAQTRRIFWARVAVGGFVLWSMHRKRCHTNPCIPILYPQLQQLFFPTYNYFATTLITMIQRYAFEQALNYGRLDVVTSVNTISQILEIAKAQTQSIDKLLRLTLRRCVDKGRIEATEYLLKQGAPTGSDGSGREPVQPYQ
ncbi:hypothetical protein BDZ45DRAFT_755163 [Acephala macrosclerotiorum]|nr:hypothetical protein BDZ45DRAFT_755163 [Acephala macrosclerotiorum]